MKMRIKTNFKSKIKISSEYKWVLETKKEKPWYAKGLTSILVLFILTVIDLAGFVQGVFKLGVLNLKELELASLSQSTITVLGLVVMVLGFLVAFEVATIYMAYAFSLKLYNYDRSAIKRIKSKKDNPRISKYISTSMLGWISFIAFLLGVILNTIFRIGTVNGTVKFFQPNTCLISPEWAITIVMIFLPIITSIMNFVIGCFTFDPLLFELNYLAKQITELSGQIEKIESEEKNVNVTISNITNLKKSALEDCNNAIRSVTGLRTKLRTRIYEEEMRKIK